MITNFFATAQVSPTQPDESAAILHLAHAAAIFNEEEVATVDELLRVYFDLGPERSRYLFLSCRAGARLLGFACCGPRPLTQGVFDLHWIVVDPAASRQGAGSALLARAVAEVRARRGRLILAETSSRPPYAAARGFYLRRGFALEATIRDFYDRGDDLLIYVLRL